MKIQSTKFQHTKMKQTKAVAFININNKLAEKQIGKISWACWHVPLIPALGGKGRWSL